MIDLNVEEDLGRIILIGHTEHSYLFCQKGMGEVSHCRKLHTLLEQAGYDISPVIDIFDLFGGEQGKEHVDRISQLINLNQQLISLGYEPLTECDDAICKRVFAALGKAVSSEAKQQTFVILSWEWNVGALHSVGIKKCGPLVAKCYVPLEGSSINTQFFKRCDFIVTECLYANLLGIASGIPPGKMLYLPHHYPNEVDNLYKISESEVRAMRKTYLQRLAHRMGKKTAFPEDAIVVGVVSRLKQGKNVEDAIRAFEIISRDIPNAYLVLKSGSESSIIGDTIYQDQLRSLLNEVRQAPWFLWDQEVTAFPEVLKVYRLFDCCMFLSGIEGASNTAVEMISLGRPCLLLKENTNPYLFQGGAIFIDDSKAIEKTHVPYVFHRRPDRKQLVEQLKALIQHPHKREWLSRQARAIALNRFSPQAVLQRIPLLLKAARNFYTSSPCQEYYHQAVQRQLEEDLALYDISVEKDFYNSMKAQFLKY